jgi:hypothetical protein
VAKKYKRSAAINPQDAVRVGSVRTFLDALEKIEKPSDSTFFYRGHPSFTYLLKPSIYRDARWVENEDIMFKELILRCPNDFTSLASTFQTLVKMQHYGLPTRLLDLTANPLIALYFACDPADPPSESGEVLAFGIPTTEVKYYDSDTVSVIANIARRPTSFVIPPESLTKTEFNKDSTIRYLLHEIKQEKPYFEAEIVREHLESVVCVRPKLENPRIIRQDGAFFLFGVNGSKPYCASIQKRYIATSSSKRILIIGSEKRRIRSQLESLGIFQATVYPEIDRVADFLKDHYASPSET